MLQDLRKLQHEIDVAPDGLRGLGTLDLHDHALAPGQYRAVNLPDGRGRHRLLLETLKGPVEGEAQLLGYHPLHDIERERGHHVLKLDQLLKDVLGHDIRARAEHLAELDEGRPQLVEHLPDVAATLRREVLTAPTG